MYKSVGNFLAGVIVLATFTSQGRAQQINGTANQENAFQFNTATPSDEHISSAALAKIFPYVQSGGVNLHSLLIIKNSNVILEAYFYPYRAGLKHDFASCTKSVTSLLIGIAIDHHFIPDENQLVRQYFPEIKTYSKNFRTLTIKNLLTMTSGLDCGSDNEDVLFDGLYQSANWPAYIFNIPSATEPGKQFSYCSCNFQLLAEILYRATKLTPGQFANKYLFKPLGISQFYWETNSQGINHGWGDLALDPRNFAKIGLMLMNLGKWNNRQIISAGYVKKATARQVPFADGKGYGYGFWVDSEDAFNAVGRGGQRMYVDHRYKVIIIATGGGYDWDEKGGLSDLISAAIVLKDESGPNALDTLLARTHRAAYQVNISAPNFRSQPENHFFNKEIRFSKNKMGIKNARIVIGRDTTLNLTWNNGNTIIYPLGLGPQYCFYHDPVSRHVFALRAYWKANADFQIDFNMLTKINRYLIDFKLAQVQPEVDITEGTQSINEKIPVEIL